MKKAIVAGGVLVISFVIFFIFNPAVGQEVLADMKALDFSGLREQIRLFGEMLGIR